MTKEERIAGFTKLGQIMNHFDADFKDELFSQAANTNPWFTPPSIEQALNGISHFLTQVSLSNWLDQYNLPEESKQIGIVMAGNIPLVGLHDFLCVLMAGHRAVIKLSSQDRVLFPAVLKMLIKINPKFSEQIKIVDKLSGIDAVIATGSDNSSRYFKKYFKDIPHIIRQNRTSIAILNGGETIEELKLLGNDIFSFFGLGCRNIAKVFVPVGYDMTVLLGALEDHHEIINHPKYFNNYEYNKAIYLVNSTTHLDTGFALFTQSSEVVSPLAVVYYEEYRDEQQLNRTLHTYADKIQCIVSNNKFDTETVPIGNSQLPNIDDYADSIDTMAFLCDLPEIKIS